MCNLYRLSVPPDQIDSVFQSTADPGGSVDMDKDYAAPGKPGWVIRDEAGRRLRTGMRWGFPFNGRPVTNVRNYRSPFWASALATPARRCLVPVTEFQEWSAEPMPQTGRKQAFWFSVPSRPVFAFAGIWRPAEGGALFAFLTCGYDGDPAGHLVGAIHPKACPVILHPEDHDRWLRGDVADVLDLATPYPSQLMTVR